MLVRLNKFRERNFTRLHCYLMKSGGWYCTYHKLGYHRLHWLIFLLFVLGIIVGIYISLSGLLHVFAHERGIQYPCGGGNADCAWADRSG